MREIDLDKDTATRTTVLSYGPMRSGKTRWAATWPRPLFLSDNTESGWTTIKNMPDELFFEPGRRPKVWAIEQAVDMMAAISKIDPLIRRGEVQTVVVDSLTFYAQLYLSFLEATTSRGSKQADGRQIYGNLQTHLRALRVQLHALPVNVVWICLDVPPGEDDPMGRPDLPGSKNPRQFAAGCDYILYHRPMVDPKTNLHTWEMRTRRYLQFVAGGRDEGRLPDPLGYWADPQLSDGNYTFYPDCAYNTFAQVLGLLK